MVRIMKNSKLIEANLFGSEQIICSAKQSKRLLLWLIKNLIIFILVMGLPIGLFLLLPIVPAEWKDFVNAHQYIYYIYAGIAGLWFVILFVKFLINISYLASYQVFLTTKRVILVHSGQLTTVFFNSITSVTMKAGESDGSRARATIEIETPSANYHLKKMKNGNRLVGMLTNILLGGTIKIKTNSEESKPDTKDSKVETPKENAKVETKTTIKPNVKSDKLPKTEMDASDQLIKKTEAKSNETLLDKAVKNNEKKLDSKGD